MSLIEKIWITLNKLIRNIEYIDIKGAAGEGSEGNKEHVIGNQRKESPYCIKAENLAELCPTVVWKAELVSDVYLAEEISKENVEGTPWFLLAACG